MTNSLAKRFAPLFALGLLLAASASAATHFTHPVCLDSVSASVRAQKCITIYAHHYADGGGGGHLDRISAKINAASCTYTNTEGKKVTVSGNDEMSLDSGDMPLDRSWTVPAECPAWTHARKVNDSWAKDDIFVKEYGPSTSDHCFKYDWWHMRTASSGCD